MKRTRPWQGMQKAARTLLIVPLTIALAACASGTVLDRYQSDYVPAGSLRLGQVMQVAKGEEVLRNKQLHGFVSASGVSDSDIANGTIVLARIFCCGGLTRETSSEVANSRVVYVPQGLQVEPEDVIEMRVGHAAQGGSPAVMNRATRVVQKSGREDGSCWWDPRNDRLWLRILYCTWMPKEGWVKQAGVNPAWYKPPAGSTGS